MFASRTPAQAYALLVGIALLVGGAIGFLYTAAFGAPGETSKVLGLLEVNGWHNTVHLVSGLLGVAVAGSPAASRTYAGAFGATYLVVAIWGLTLGSSGNILTFLPVNLADDLLHVFIAVGGVLAYLASKERGTVAQRIA